jgi:hypothetical protein
MRGIDQQFCEPDQQIRMQAQFRFFQTDQRWWLGVA